MNIILENEQARSIIASIPQAIQSQESLSEQLLELKTYTDDVLMIDNIYCSLHVSIANRLGLYDAADHLQSMNKNRNHE